MANKLANIGKSMDWYLWRIKNRARKRTIIKFAEKFGLVYFGYVNQNTDDHNVVRGLTVSATHHDNHYCVGSNSGYDISFVDRGDTIWTRNNVKKLCNWQILTFKLHTDVPVPHFFINAKNRPKYPYSALFSTFPNMKEVIMGTFEKYNHDFTSRFDIFARPAKSMDVEKIITADVARTIGAHFWPHSIEQHDNILYVYTENARVCNSGLDTMMECGLWLAGIIDKSVDNITEKTD